jgi:hypothetical protein
MLHYIRNGNLYEAAKSVGATRKSRGHVLSKKNRKPLSVDAVSNSILELQYGWRPLLSDVHGAAHTLANRLNVDWQTTYRVKREKRIHEVVGSPGPSWVRQGRRLVALKVVLKTRPTLSTQLHLNDPLSVAWEVLPWSFVADWFLPIGSYLSAVDTYRSFDYEFVLRTTVTEHKQDFLSVGNSSISDVLHGSYLRDFSVARGLDTFGLFPPAPSVKDFSKALQPEHLLNAFALLTSTTSNFRKSLKF